MTSSVPGAKQAQVDSENLLDLDARVRQIFFGIQISEGFCRELLTALQPSLPPGREAEARGVLSFGIYFPLTYLSVSGIQDL